MKKKRDDSRDIDVPVGDGGRLFGAVGDVGELALVPLEVGGAGTAVGGRTDAPVQASKQAHRQAFRDGLNKKI